MTTRIPLILCLSVLCMALISCSALADGCGRSKGKICPSIYQPVCGKDGKTYANSCVAQSPTAYPGKCLSYKVKVPKCKKGWRVARKVTKGPASKTCPKGICTTLFCKGPALYIRGTYSDPTCKGGKCIASTHPFKGAVFSCPKGYAPISRKNKAGKSVQRCKRK